MACIFVPVSHRLSGVYFPQQDYLEKYRRCVKMACSFVAVVLDSVSVVVGRSSASGRGGE